MEANERVAEWDSPIRGLKPRDFNTDWPTGKTVIPEKLLGRGLTPEQVESTVRGVLVLRQLAKDIIDYVAGGNTTQEALAEMCGINPAAVTRVKRGHKFPQTHTFLVLRARVPTQEQMARGDFNKRSRPTQPPQG